MKIYLDSANVNEIREAMSRFPIDGVTTNPTILARTGNVNPVALLHEIRACLGGATLFVQVTENEPDAILYEARKICAAFGKDTVIKVPVNAQNISVMKTLSAEGISVCATAVYTVPQALLAAKSGSAFAAPYVSHLDAMAIDGPELAIRMQQTLRTQGYSTNVLGASFRVVSQVEKLMAGGVDAVTVTFDMLRAIASSQGSDKELCSFNENWHRAYAGKHLMDFN